MKTIVICHGMSSGGWAWKEVKILLEKEGHTVYTPTMTGCGERFHLANKEVDLNTAINDIVNVINYENLHNIVLIGHSYGGAVASGVVDLIPELIDEVIYLDAMLLNDGEAVVNLFPDEIANFIQRLIDTKGDGWKVPVVEEDRYDHRLTDHPHKCFKTPLNLKNKELNNIKTSYINCTEKEQNPFYYGIFRSVERAKERGMTIHNLKAGHIPNIENPALIAQFLLNILS
ncbi:alpha/beta fold hydrolase [Gottfriedia acidiceleris]|uniref:alpha/beta fold hydrolase n=1 Tax=Gottfriedia acidiceleris TaxID=371036 RepID=UPI00101C9D6A|nr:alpha/beta fold hydrolase [Gottfriedia acidiceleris]